MSVVKFLPFQLLRAIVNDPQLMKTIEPREFEKLIAELLHLHDFEGINLTPQSRDGGLHWTKVVWYLVRRTADFGHPKPEQFLMARMLAEQRGVTMIRTLSPSHWAACDWHRNCVMSSTLFHVTPTRNVDSIVNRGLIANCGQNFDSLDLFGNSYAAEALGSAANCCDGTAHFMINMLQERMAQKEHWSIVSVPADSASIKFCMKDPRRP